MKIRLTEKQMLEVYEFVKNREEKPIPKETTTPAPTTTPPPKKTEYTKPPEGTIPWRSQFGSNLGDRTSQTKAAWIPSGGLVIAFTVPEGDAERALQVSTTEYSGNKSPIIHSVSEVPGDFDHYTRELCTGVSGGIICGINVDDYDIDLIPGQMYFWNIQFSNKEHELRWLRYAYVELD